MVLTIHIEKLFRFQNTTLKVQEFAVGCLSHVKFMYSATLQLISAQCVGISSLVNSNYHLLHAVKCLLSVNDKNMCINAQYHSAITWL